MRNLLLSTVILVFLGSKAFSDDCLHSRGGSWVSQPDAGLPVRLVVANHNSVMLEVAGRALEISQRHVSPDRQTTLLWWDGGEGVLTCEDGDRVSLSLFDRSIPTRRLTLVRP